VGDATAPEEESQDLAGGTCILRAVGMRSSPPHSMNPTAREPKYFASDGVGLLGVATNISYI
jgi:hypothetical protein